MEIGSKLTLKVTNNKCSLCGGHVEDYEEAQWIICETCYQKHGSPWWNHQGDFYKWVASLSIDENEGR